jgi:hypothetical protein
MKASIPMRIIWFTQPARMRRALPNALRHIKQTCLIAFLPQRFRRRQGYPTPTPEITPTFPLHVQNFITCGRGRQFRINRRNLHKNRQHPLRTQSLSSHDLARFRARCIHPNRKRLSAFRLKPNHQRLPLRTLFQHLFAQSKIAVNIESDFTNPLAAHIQPKALFQTIFRRKQNLRIRIRANLHHHQPAVFQKHRSHRIRQHPIRRQSRLQGRMRPRKQYSLAFRNTGIQIQRLFAAIHLGQMRNRRICGVARIQGYQPITSHPEIPFTVIPVPEPNGGVQGGYRIQHPAIWIRQIPRPNRTAPQIHLGGRKILKPSKTAISQIKRFRIVRQKRTGRF